MTWNGHHHVGHHHTATIHTYGPHHRFLHCRVCTDKFAFIPHAAPSLLLTKGEPILSHCEERKEGGKDLRTTSSSEDER